MDERNNINTGGGPAVQGNANAEGDFVGRDVNNSTSLSRNLSVSGNLIVAVVAVLLVGIVGITAIVRRSADEAARAPIATIQPAQIFPSLTQTSDSQTSPPPSDLLAKEWQTCVGQYFADVKRKEWIAVEVGALAQALPFSFQDQSTTGMIGPLGVVVTENGQPLAAINFTLFAGSRVFKIKSVVNAHCQVIEDYSNATRPGSKNDTLQDFDALKIQLSEGSYTVRFNWDGGDAIEFDVRRVN